MPIDGIHLLEYAIVIADKVACQHDDVWPESGDALEYAQHVAIVDARTNVNIADLRERLTVEGEWQVADRQRPDDEIEPVRLDAPSVELLFRLRRQPRWPKRETAVVIASIIPS